MADHTVNSMRAAARSMRDVVLPAVDPSHPLAAEQAGLILKYLDFWAGRLNHLNARNVAELRCYLRMGEALQHEATEVSPEIARLLVDEVARARAVVTSTSPDLPAAHQALAGLTRTITALVRAAADGDHPAATAIERTVAAHSREVALLQRSWFAPQGWEDPAPSELGDVLDQLLTEGTHP